MKKLLLALIGLQVLTVAPALACAGQVGKVIYDDNFADDSGGWDLSPPVTSIAPPNLLIDLSNKATLTSTQVLTFKAKEADYCVEAILPKPVADNNNYYIGVEFWATDANNYWMAQVSPAGSLTFWQRTNGNWQNLFRAANAPVKPDGVVALRAQIAAGKISIYVNGQLMKAIRAQEPDTDMRFGIYGQSDLAIDGAATPIKVTRYTVTAGQ